MRDHLYGCSAVIAVALFLKNIPVHTARGHVAVLRQVFIDKTLVMSQIQIGLCTVIGYKYLAVLKRVHRTWVNIQIRVKLLHRHTQSARLQQTPQRCCSNSFSQARHYTAGHKYKFRCHNFLLPAIALLKNKFPTKLLGNTNYRILLYRLSQRVSIGIGDILSDS